MEWLGLHVLAELPATGRLILDCHHNPYLVALAYLVACAGSFATLDMIERISNAEQPSAQRQWRLLGTFSLACSIWGMHFISMLAFDAVLEVHYDVVLTGTSLLVMLLAAWMALDLLSRTELHTRHYLLAAGVIGLGIGAMHYTGMAAMRSNAQQYYRPDLLAASVVIAFGASLLAWNGKMAILERQLESTGNYVLGEDFSLADIVLGLSVNRWKMTPMEHPDFPAVAAYYERLSLRPGFVLHGRNGTP